MKINLSNFFKNILRKHFMSNRRKEYQRLYDKSSIINITYDIKQSLPKKIETEWLQRYRKLDSKASLNSLRFYSHYVTNYNHIIPYETYSLYISPLLNPLRYKGVYDDKNNLDIILPKEYIARTIIRRIEGVYKDKNYAVIPDASIDTIIKYFNNCNSLIIKPSYGSAGGNAIKKIIKENNKWLVDDKEISMEFLNNYSDNFIIQECIIQSEYLNQFNKSSVNTMRMCVYRSIKTDEISILVNMLRIGKSGSVADNIFLGGHCIKINSDGTLANELFDNYGNIIQKFNGIDFSKEKFRIPNYEYVKKFGIEVAKHYPHHHLLALDIAMDQDNQPKLVEVNADAFSIEMPYFAHVDLFGDKTDEVLEFALKHQKYKFTNIYL